MLDDLPRAAVKSEPMEQGSPFRRFQGGSSSPRQQAVAAAAAAVQETRRRQGNVRELAPAPPHPFALENRVLSLKKMWHPRENGQVSASHSHPPPRVTPRQRSIHFALVIRKTTL